MNFVERFRKPRQLEKPVVTQVPEVSNPHFEVLEGGTLEDQQRMAALKASQVHGYIKALHELPEVKIVNSSTWHPTICVLDYSHSGDEQKYECFDVVGKENGSVQIGHALLTRAEASEYELVDHAFVKALESAQTIVYGNPHEVLDPTTETTLSME